MALFKILKGNKENLPKLKREGFAYFTVDENDFYIDTEGSETNADGSFKLDANGNPIGGVRKQLNANRARYLKSKDTNLDGFHDLYIDDEEISLGRVKGESNYEDPYYGNSSKSGLRSIAVGNGASALGNYSSSFGSNTRANGINSHAEGSGSQSNGQSSHTEGVDTQATGDFSHAEGQTSFANGYASHAEGNSTTNGNYSHAEGYKTIADKEYSHAEGNTTKALGIASHAEGVQTGTVGIASHAEGVQSIAYGIGSHAEGTPIVLDEDGNETSIGPITFQLPDGTSLEDVSVNIAYGDGSHAEGILTVAYGQGSHSEGIANIASGTISHVEGGENTASGLGSHAEGLTNMASGDASHVEGVGNTASNDSSHAEGQGTIADGEGAHAEGSETNANGNFSHAEGKLSIASGNNSHAEGLGSKAEGENSHTEGNTTTASGQNSHAEGGLTIASGASSHAEGQKSEATGYASHAEGNNTMAEKEGAHSEGLGAKALGEGSHAEGNQTEAQGNYSHAEGTGSLAIGVASHAEGEDTEAIGIASHAEGNACIALGNYSHAGGNGSETEEHEGAFVHGLKLYAQSNYQTVFGKYSDANENDAFVIGNGTAEGYESNAFKVQWDGTAELKETLLVGRDPADSLEVATKQYVDRKINTASDDKMYSFTTQTTSATDTITFSNDSVDVNACLVYYNGLLLILGESYTVSDAKTIVLNGWSANAGDFFTVTGKQGSDQAGSGSLNCGTVGSASKPVYFLEGIPVACSNNLEVSITGASAKATLDSKDQNIASTYFKSVAWKTGLANSATPQLTLTKGDNTTVNLDIDYRVKQNVLTSNSGNIPLLLKSTGQKAVDEVNYSNALTYNINSGYLHGASIDCGEWIEGDADPICCFVSGTQILVDLDGDTKNIEDMKPGDLAVAYDIEKEINYMAVVKDVIVKDNVVDVAKVKFENGATLKMNAYHPIYTTNGWHSLTNYKNYDTLLVDDICRTSNGWSKIVDIERYYSNPLKMYTLNLIDIDEMDEIDNEVNDNFFANGIVVHNASCATN